MISKASVFESFKWAIPFVFANFKSCLFIGLLYLAWMVALALVPWLNYLDWEYSLNSYIWPIAFALFAVPWHYFSAGVSLDIRQLVPHKLSIGVIKYIVLIFVLILLDKSAGKLLYLAFENSAVRVQSSPYLFTLFGLLIKVLVLTVGFGICSAIALGESLSLSDFVSKVRAAIVPLLIVVVAFYLIMAMLDYILLGVFYPHIENMLILDSEIFNLALFKSYLVMKLFFKFIGLAILISASTFYFKKMLISKKSRFSED
ncbi:hypothetical protein A9Q83_05520 [Alphaproteobacteria bacterium 46_93_T64]|nr:hypothetical protein A9Q83_05520 [Alphaproteobacteria bacterium 46_93_T64]